MSQGINWKVAYRNKPYRNKQWLAQKYQAEELPLSKIAKICDVCAMTIYHWLCKFEIPLRTGNDLSTKKNAPQYCNKEWLLDKYINKEKSREDIALECSVTSSTIGYWLHKHRIPMRKCWELAYRKIVGDKNTNWKGGRVATQGGYIYVYSPNHPNKVKMGKTKSGGYVLEHRLAMEEHLGRYLYPWETVHHINGVKNDNRIENLKLLPGNEHNNKIQEIYNENLQLKSLLLLLLCGRGAV